MNAADIVADRLVTRGIYLERYKAGFNGMILSEIEKLEDELTKELVTLFKRGVSSQSARVQRMESLLGQSRQVIRRAYTEKSSLAGKELLRLVANEQSYVVGAVNSTAGLEIFDRVLNYDELKNLTNNTLIEGAKSADWWVRQGDDLQNRFTDEMRRGVLRGENLDQLIARVRGTQARAFTDGVMQLPRRQAEALVRTSVQSLANATRLASYQANADVISAIQWVSTLDSRTTHICMALNGKLWTTKGFAPLGHGKAWPGTTAHWQCRSTQVPVIKKWEDLVASQDKSAVDEEFRRQLRKQGFDDDAIAAIQRDTKASLDGQVAKDLTFDEWLGGKSTDFQDTLLGKGRGKLFRDNKITLTDLVDQRGRPLTLDELMNLSQPRPGPAVVKLPNPRKPRAKPPAPPVRGPNEFPPLNEIETVRKLGGSTGAELVKDTQNGKLYVKKTGNSADHIREEFAADEAYRAAGVDVPRAILYDSPAGPVKLAEYIEGKTLNEFMASAPKKDVAAALGKLRKGFTTDATLANYDVVGLSLDNVLIDAKGIPWRIDNGGSLRFRAQGAPKTNWGAVVSELESMRDAGINPQTASVFAEITESEIEDQIRDLLTRETQILAAVPDPVKPVLTARFASLRARLDALVNEDLARRVRDAKVKGVSVPGDRDEFEDVQFMFWQERAKDGTPITAAKVKLTTRGADKVMDAIRTSIPKTAKAPKVAAPLAQDVYWDRILQALKTINTHYDDGKYNVAKIEALKAAKVELQALATPTKALQEMKAHYLNIIDQAEIAMNARVPTANYAQFIVKPPAPKPVAAVKGTLNVKEEALQWPVKKIVKGQATRTDELVKVRGEDFKQDGYLIDFGDVKVRFVPYRPGDRSYLKSTNAQALMGQVEVEMPGEATRQNLTRVIEVMKQVGLSPAKATPEYLEAVWLRKTLRMRTDLVDNATRARMTDIMELDGIEDAERVRQLREIAVQKLGIDPPRDPAMWMPRTDSQKQGWGVTERWDMTAAQVKKEMKEYAISHSTSTELPQLVATLLTQGGELTSTSERLRKGVQISSGMSPDSDLVKGGATHIYTRIKKRESAYTQPGFVFKATTLARQDAFTFDSDWYGGVDDFFRTEEIYNARAKTVADLKKYARNGSNETLFKWNLSIIDDIEVIVVNTPLQRIQVVEKYTAAGLGTLPDGRKIEDVVRLASSPIP